VSTPLLAAALAAEADGVVISRRTSPRGAPVVVFANAAFLALTGRTIEQLVGRPHRELHADAVEFAPARGSAAGPRGTAGEGSLLRADGGTISAAWSIMSFNAGPARDRYLIATYRDTTEKRRLQESLVHAQRLDAVGRLAGGVAHDFNNLLSVINGYCEILAAQLSDRTAALREVNEIHRAGLRASALTRQLLAFGRRTPMDPHVINLNRLVQENADILRRLIGTAGRLQLELAPDLANVRADPTQFQQVLLNLVLNARDALRDHGCVTLRTAEREVKPGLNRRATDTPPGRYVSLTVADNGTGMDADTQKHLFEPFFTTKPEGKGTGLGLALVYGVVQQSSGFINVRSALLAGSSFEILLPRVDAPEEAEPHAMPALPANTGNEALLVVEPDDVVRKMVAGMLTASGYAVVAAKQCDEALELARSADRPPQLTIVASSREGESLVQTLRAGGASTRVLWVGQGDNPVLVTWMPEGEQATISKPFALSEILRAVRALLDG
jgi:PAS domain S-box-containing protein